MKNLSLRILISILLFSCGNSKNPEKQKFDQVELSLKKRVDSIENLKFSIFNQPDSVYISESFTTYINDFVDSLFRSSCYGQSFGTTEGIVIRNRLLSGEDRSLWFNYDDTSTSSVSFNKFNKLVHYNKDLHLIQEKTDEIYSDVYEEEMNWDDGIRFIPVKFKLDNDILNLVKKDRSLPFYFKESLLKNIPIFLMLRSRKTNYKGNSFEDGGVNEEQAGKTYDYGNYQSSGRVVSISFMYLEPKKDDKTSKMIPYLPDENMPKEFAERQKNIKYFTSCFARNRITDEYDSLGKINKKNILNGFFGYYEVGRIDQGTQLGSLKVLENRYKFIEQASTKIDINYSSGEINNKSGSEDISAMLIKCITNIPLNETSETLFNFNGGYLQVFDKELKSIFLTLFYTSKPMPIHD